MNIKEIWTVYEPLVHCELLQVVVVDRNGMGCPNITKQPREKNYSGQYKLSITCTSVCTTYMYY